MPSPPKVVPSNANSAWSWLIGRSCPAHKAQPLGAKPNAKARISPRNCSDIALFSYERSATDDLTRSGDVRSRESSRPRRENSLQRDAPVDRQIGLQVVVRLAAAGAADH